MHSSLANSLTSGRTPLALALLLLGSCAAPGFPRGEFPTGVAAATPQRPTLSSDTNTAVEGTVELEAGLTWDPDSFIDTPASLRFGAGPATEVFLGFSPLLYVEQPGNNESGPGDLAFGFRHRFRTESGDSPATAIQTSVKLPTADDKKGLGSGELDASIAGIATKTFGDYGVTGFYSLNLLGEQTGGAALGHSLSLSTSTPKFDDLSFFGELAGIFVPEQDSEQVFTMVGCTFNPHSSSVFDVGVLVGLTQDAPDLQFVIGFTQNLGPARGLHRRWTR